MRGKAGGGGMEKEGKEVAGDAQERRRKGCGRFSSFSFYLGELSISDLYRKMDLLKCFDVFDVLVV